MTRPETYTFSSVEDLIASIEKWEGKEGVCIYYHDGQAILKCKSSWYLRLHHMKSELSSCEKVLDVWISKGYPSYMDFYNYIATTFDYELAEQIRGHISNICDGYVITNKIIDGMLEFISKNKHLTRKDFAAKVFASYGGVGNNRAAFVFTLLDKGKLTGDNIKKLLFQVLKS